MQKIFMIFIQWLIPFACASGFAVISRQLKENKKSNDAMKASMLSLIRSQIVGKCENYMKQGYLPEYAMYCLEELFEQYKVLGGNHGIEVLVNKCYELPISKKEGWQ